MPGYDYWNSLLESECRISTRQELTEGAMTDLLSKLFSIIKEHAAEIKEQAAELKRMTPDQLKDYLLDLGERVQLKEDDFNRPPKVKVSESLAGDLVKKVFSSTWNFISGTARWFWGTVTAGDTEYILLAALGYAMVHGAIYLADFFGPVAALLHILWGWFGVHFGFALNDYYEVRDKPKEIFGFQY